MPPFVIYSNLAEMENNAFGFFVWRDLETRDRVLLRAAGERCGDEGALSSGATCRGTPEEQRFLSGAFRKIVVDRESHPGPSSVQGKIEDKPTNKRR